MPARRPEPEYPFKEARLAAGLTQVQLALKARCGDVHDHPRRARADAQPNDAGPSRSRAGLPAPRGIPQCVIRARSVIRDRSGATTTGDPLTTMPTTGGEDDGTVAAKRAFGIGDPLLLERRARDLAESVGAPLGSLDLALWNWGRGERARLGLPPETTDAGVLARARTALGVGAQEGDVGDRA